MGNIRKARRAASQKKNRPVPTQQQPSGGKRWVRPLIWGAGLTALVVGVVFIVSDVSDNPQERPSAPEGVEVIAVGEPRHVEGAVAYDPEPPAGGPHNPGSLPCQAYDEPVANELAVHSLEHGAAWITYRPDLPSDEISTLRSLARRAEVIVSPYPGLDSSVVATVWGRQLRADSADDERIEQFVRALINTTAPENGAFCS